MKYVLTNDSVCSQQQSNVKAFIIAQSIMFSQPKTALTLETCALAQIIYSGNQVTLFPWCY